MLLKNSGTLINGNDWGTDLSTDNLATFGLHSSYPGAKETEIDPVKLMRIVPTLENYFNDSYILTYNEIREINQLLDEQHFTLNVRTPLNMNLEILGSSTLNASLTYLTGTNIENADVSFFYYDGNNWNTMRNNTNSNGIATVNTGVLDIQIAIAVGWKDHLWSISFIDDENFTRDQNMPIFINQINSTYAGFMTNTTYYSNFNDVSMELLSGVTQRTTKTNVTIENTDFIVVGSNATAINETIATGVTIAVIFNSTHYNFQTTPALLDDSVNPHLGHIPTNAEAIVESIVSICRGVCIQIEYTYSEY
jgi:hypothetical protein